MCPWPHDSMAHCVHGQMCVHGPMTMVHGQMCIHGPVTPRPNVCPWRSDSMAQCVHGLIFVRTDNSYGLGLIFCFREKFLLGRAINPANLVQTGLLQDSPCSSDGLFMTCCTYNMMLSQRCQPDMCWPAHRKATCSSVLELQHLPTKSVILNGKKIK